MQLISAKEVYSLLSVTECIPLMEQALAALASGKAHQVVRMAMPLEGRNVLGLMPAAMLENGIFGVKVLSVFPDNARRGVESHQGQMLVFESDTGRLLASADAGAITGVRTAAASAAATKALAREDASALAILGAGLQGRQHVLAMQAVRPIKTVKVWDIRPEAAAAFAKEMAEKTGLTVTACESAREACLGADIICTLTPAKEPIVDLCDVKVGAHINAVGACTANAREIGSALMGKSRVFVDWAEAAFKEAGDILLAVKDGAMTLETVAGEVGGVIAGTLPGRQSEEEITLFEALGQATEDLIAAQYILSRYAETK